MRDVVVVAAHAWYGDVVGGSFRLATEFAQHLAATGREVFYLCCAKDSASDSRATVDGVHLRRYPPPSEKSGFSRLRHHVRESARLMSEIGSEHRVTQLSGHSPLQFLGASRAAPSDCFSNYTVHSPFDDEVVSHSLGPARLKMRIRALAARRVDRKNVLAAHRMQTDSQYTLRTMIRKHGPPAKEKGVVSPGWVDFNSFSGGTMGDPPKDSGNIPTFFTLRRLEPRMGLETLIEAADILKRHGKRFRVVIGGDGSLAQPLAESVARRDLAGVVELIGRVPHEAVVPLYRVADCFVLPTRALECFGLIVLEAFAAGTPVIGSSVAAIPELVSQQGDAWLFEPGNAEELAARMEQFLRGELRVDVDLREVARRYDKPRVLEQWTKLLQPA